MEVPHPQTFSTVPFLFNTPEERLESNERYYSRVFSVKDTFVTAKRFHDWHRSGLLPFLIPAGKKNLMSLPEFVWVKLIDRLRQVGTPLEQIQMLKEELFKVPDFLGLAQQLEQEGSAQMSLVIRNSGLSEEDSQAVLEDIETGALFKGLDEKRTTLLDMLLFRLLTVRDEIGVMLSPNGYVQIWMESLGVPRWNTTHVYLSITDEVNVFRSNKLWEQRTEHLKELTQEEWEVIWAIRNKQAKEVTVTFLEKGEHRQMDITTTSDEEVDYQQLDKIIEKIMHNSYSTVTIKTNGNGKALYLERKTRKRVQQ